MDVRALGCKVNFADTHAVAGRLELERGQGPGKEAPVELVGTCCVTAEAEKQSRKEVRRALARVGPAGRVLVTGCAARLAPESFRRLGGQVEVLGGDQATGPAAGGRVAAAESRAGASGRTRFFLKIQDGCANMCAYCVVPLVRGRPRSVPLDFLLEEADCRVREGFPELVLSGINLGAWNDRGAALPELIRQLLKTPGLMRLRLSSIEVTDVTPALLEAMSASDAVGRHLHLPLQSGDDGVLAAMGRRYTAAQFAGTVAAARAALPGVNLTTDVITGYPAEDRGAFERTLAFVEETGFSKVHVFTYSSRPGTKAAVLDDTVPAAEKQRRSRALRELSGRLGQAHRQRKVGRVSEILFESGKGPGQMSGYSSDYTRFVADGQTGAVLAPVLAESVSGEMIMGKIVSAETAADAGSGGKG
ncbi:MAG: MiaB/RimO family radical SAM methylthiotransferase [Actinomycetota bacterium]|nr:MiaB/RimO family radical SAM methylthiotransferase [Actinomycetota bacterium]MCL6093368.1 MiaB/RimO family radical SAM methylthiotransferase [Actinomycetota bacterium]MDA8167968.1 MiaB/RimO family radical SAM methylthiotransferase [Actinomycetota bacterium]